jgi:hypothetical protein
MDLWYVSYVLKLAICLKVQKMSIKYKHNNLQRKADLNSY